jgi:hypothetical protein
LKQAFALWLSGLWAVGCHLILFAISNLLIAFNFPNYFFLMAVSIVVISGISSQLSL